MMTTTSILLKAKERIHGLHTNTATFVCGLLVTTLIALLALVQPHFLQSADYSIYDLLLSAAPRMPVSHQLVVVEIDEQSLAAYGQWPWPRYRMARLLDGIKEMGARSVGIDILFAETDRTSPARLATEMSKELGADIRFSGVPEGYMDNDAVLARTLAQGPFVLGYYFSATNTGQPESHSLQHSANILVKRDSGVAHEGTVLPHPGHVSDNITILAEAAPFSGFFNVQPDSDGIIRRVPLLMEFNHKLYPNLALATLIQAFGPKYQLVLKVNPHGAESLLINDREIPLTANGSMLIRFQQSPSSPYPHIPASRILDHSADPRLIANKIVFVGPTAAGLTDTQATPFNASTPGAELYATVVDTIDQGRAIARPFWVMAAELLLVMITGLLTSAVLARTRAIWGVVTLSVGALLLWLISSWLFNRYALHLSPFFPLLTLITCFTLLSLLKYWQQEQRSVKIIKEVITLLKASNIPIEDKSIKMLGAAMQQLTEANRKIAESIDYAAMIQRSLLPLASEVRSFLPESFFIWEPRDVVSGDIYFACPVAEGCIVAVVDCTGHGIPGALLTMIAVSGLRKIIVMEGCTDPALILNKLNVIIKSTLRQDTESAVSNDGMEVSICLLHKTTRTLTFAGARQPLAVAANGAVTVIKGDRQMLGYRQSKKSDIHFTFSNHTVPLPQPTTVYLYTDGLVDQLGGDKHLPFGNKRLLALLEKIHALPCARQAEIITREFAEFRGLRERMDDVTVVGFSL